MSKMEKVRKPIADYYDVLSVGDIQEILGIGRKQVYKLIEEGALFALRPGRSYIIAKNSLISYLNGGRDCNAEAEADS